MSRLERAQEIVTLITAALTASTVTDVTVTVDSQKIEDALFHGPVVCVQPPRIDFTTYTIFDATWEVHIISRHDRITAWQELDKIIDAMELAYMPLVDAEPANFQPREGPAVPAYIVRLKETMQLVPDG